MERVASAPTKCREHMSGTIPVSMSKSYTSFQYFLAVLTSVHIPLTGTYPVFVSRSHASLLGVYPIILSRPHTFLFGTWPVFLEWLQAYVSVTSYIVCNITGLSPSATPNCYQTIPFGSSILCLQHHCTAKHAVEFEDVLHAKRGVCKTMKFLYLSQSLTQYLGSTPDEQTTTYALTLSTVC